MSIEISEATGASTPLLSSRDQGVLTLTLNRPSVLNALDAALLEALSAALREAESDDAVRAIVITGAGRAFSSGQDLKASSEFGQVNVREVLHDLYHPVITTIRSTDKPVIAAVNGVAAGAGFSLALAADLRIAARSASFVQAFVRIGLVPDAGSTFFLPALIGYARAAELMMLGETIDADRAAQLGIVNRVVADAELLPVGLEIAARLASGPKSVGIIKRLLSHTLEPGNDLERQLHHEEDAQAAATQTEDFVEGVTAFLQKRPPQFRGR